MNRAFPLLPLICGLSFALGASAEEPRERSSLAPSAQPIPSLETVKASGWLPRRGTDDGLGIAAGEGALHVQACKHRCAELDAYRSYVLPEELKGIQPKTQIVKLSKEKAALWVRYPSTSKSFYSFVFVVGVDKNGATAPRLLLKGWTKEGASSLAVESSPGGDRMLAKRGLGKSACGRAGSKIIRMLDQGALRFRRVAMSPFSEEERAGASVLASSAYEWGPKDLALKLSPRSGATTPMDANLEKSWQRGHAFSEFELFEGASRELVVELKKELSAPGFFYLADSDSPFRVEVPAGAKRVLVELPANMKEGSCLALVQPATPLPIVEVLGRTTAEKSSPAELARRLERASDAVAPAALALQGKTGAEAVAKKFGRYSKMARRKALDLAFGLSDGHGVSILIAALSTGDESDQGEALEKLKTLGEVASLALENQLTGATAASEARLAAALVALDPEAGARGIFLALNQASSARRLALREVLGRLARTEDGRGVVEELLLEQGRAKRISRRSSIEALRSLGAELRAWKSSAEPLLMKLSQGASFEEAYLLLPLWAEFLPESKKGIRMFRSWMSGKWSKKGTAVERAALAVRALEILEDGGAKTRRLFSGDLNPLFEEKNVRLRASALRVAAQNPDPKSYDRVLETLEEDSWPRVQVEAAAVLGGLGKLPKSRFSRSQREKLSSDLSSNLTDQEEPRVRRSIARALSLVGTEEAVEALRDALVDDEDYKVRSEAALSLGRTCDVQSVEVLTKYAHSLAQGVAGDGPILLGLSAVGALVRLDPPHLKKLLAPLLSDEMPGPLRARIESRMLKSESSKRCSK